MDAVVFVQEWLVVRSSPVDGIQVESRRPEVDERVWVVIPLQLRRRVEGEIMVHELAEIREASRDVRIVAGRVLFSRRLGLDHLACELLEVFVVGKEGRQVPEHAAESAFEQRGSRDRAQATQFGSVEVSSHDFAGGSRSRIWLNVLSATARI